MAWKVTNSDLDTVFEGTRGFQGCQLQIHSDSGRSKGWALVRYDTEENAETTIKELNGERLMARPIFLKFDKECKSRLYENSISVFVGNFPWDYSTSLVTELLEPFHPLYIDIATNMAGKFRGYFLVYFPSLESAESAINALNCVDINGRKIEVIYVFTYYFNKLIIIYYLVSPRQTGSIIRMLFALLTSHVYGNGLLLYFRKRIVHTG